jgi:hypothetical protein
VTSHGDLKPIFVFPIRQVPFQLSFLQPLERCRPRHPNIDASQSGIRQTAVASNSRSRAALDTDPAWQRPLELLYKESHLVTGYSETMLREIVPAIAAKRGAGSREWEMQQEHDGIELPAYELFEARGCEHGHDWEDWFRAKLELHLNE